MIRLYIAAAGLAAVVLIIGTVYFLGGQSARDRAERDAIKGTIENVDKFNKGAGNAGDCSFVDRLLAACPD